MVSAIYVLVLSVLAAAAQASDDKGTRYYPTDQSRHDQLDEINSFVQYYIESLDTEINTYERLGVVDKELRPYIDAAAVIHKLVSQSWLRNMNPDGRYSVPSEILQRQKAIDDLGEDIKRMDSKTPIADAILLFNKLDTDSLLKDRKDTISFGLKSLEESIDKAKQAEDFDKVDTLRMWKSKLSDQLESLENDSRQAAILKEMILQSYILNFSPRHDEKTVKIKHSNGLVEDERDFPVPPLDTLSVLEEIKRNFK